MYGYIEEMATYIAEGDGQVDATSVTIKRIPELVPEGIAEELDLLQGYDYPLALPE